MHIAVLLFGFTAILGDLIQLSAIMIVWWRVLLTSVALLFFIQFGQKLREIPRRQVLSYVLIGMLIALHWICFYGSVKLSNASICLICMSTTSLFTSVIEPLFLKTKIKKIEILLGLCIIPSMIFIVHHLDLKYMFGVYVGLLSALLAAIFSVLNKKNISGGEPFNISFIEMSSAFVFISIILGVLFATPSIDTKIIPEQVTDWLYLLIMALLCTCLAHVLTLKALKHISAFASNLVINLEPVYGILLSIVLLKEHHELNVQFYIGAIIIITTVFVYPFIQKKYFDPHP